MERKVTITEEMLNSLGRGETVTITTRQDDIQLRPPCSVTGHNWTRYNINTQQLQNDLIEVIRKCSKCGDTESASMRKDSFDFE